MEFLYELFSLFFIFLAISKTSFLLWSLIQECWPSKSNLSGAFVSWTENATTVVSFANLCLVAFLFVRLSRIAIGEIALLPGKQKHGACMLRGRGSDTLVPRLQFSLLSVKLYSAEKTFGNALLFSFVNEHFIPRKVAFLGHVNTTLHIGWNQAFCAWKAESRIGTPLYLLANVERISAPVFRMPPIISVSSV